MYAILVLPYIFPLLAYVNTQEKNSGNKYCSFCSNPGTHTMCLYPGKGPGESCKGYSERVIDDQEKELILHYQNYYRNKVALGYAENEYGHQPPAAGMLQLMWHDELQEIAQRWADQCIPFEDSAQHDVCKMTEEFEVGQNIITIGFLSARPMNHSEAINDWYQEMLDYDPDWLDSYKGSVKPSQKIGHYTQLVWAKSQYVGCASVSFVDLVRRKKFFVNRLVCNYGPAGNIIDATVYKVGRPCSKCPSGTSCSPHWGGLCATKEQQSAPPILAVDFSEPADWVQIKYRLAWNDVSIPAFSPITLGKRKRVFEKNTSLSITKDIELFTTSLTSTLPSPMPPKITFTLSTTLPTPSLSWSLTKPTPSNKSPTTSNVTSPTATKTTWPAIQPSTSTTKQPTRSIPEYTHKHQTSSSTEGELISFRPLEINEVSQWSNETSYESTPSHSHFWPRNPEPQTERYFRPRTVFQRLRRRWKGGVCLCFVRDNSTEGEVAFSKVKGVGTKPIRSHAGTSLPGATIGFSALALMRVH